MRCISPILNVCILYHNGYSLKARRYDISDLQELECHIIMRARYGSGPNIQAEKKRDILRMLSLGWT
jgi:hypothetical protein